MCLMCWGWPSRRRGEQITANQVLVAMDRLHGRVCALLEEHAHHGRCCRRDANRPVKHALEFMKTELSATKKLLSGREANEADWQWLNRLMLQVREVGSSLGQDVDSCLQACLSHLDQLLIKRLVKLCCCCICSIDPTLLPQLVELCAEGDPLSRYWGIMPKAVGFYHCTQDPRRYKLHPHTTKANAEGCAGAGAGAGLHLVGIDVPVKKLLRWLVMSTDKSLKVVSIVGPAGVGKTTLAMELCRQLGGQSGGGHYNFHCGATARATRGADRNKLLLQQILEEIRAPQQWASKHSRTRTYLERLHGKDQVIIDEAPGKPEIFHKRKQRVTDESPSEPDPNIAVNYGPESTTLLEHLTRDIRERLEGKRYFILIDDLWEASDWEQIKGAFPNDNNSYASQILVTTRVGSVARLCCSDYGGLVHEMKPLDVLDSEKLLHTRAFGSMDGHQPDKTTSKVCDEILRRCEGIPFFITGMADWLKQQQQQHKRRKKYAFEYIEQVPLLLKQFEQALSPAYNDLPSELRLLLLYMSMLPQGYMFEKDCLITKWLNEGLLQWDFWDKQGHKEAEEYFSKMVDRKIIIPVAANKRHGHHDVDACQWHINHFMLQFLTSKSTEMGFAFNSSTPIEGTAPANISSDKPGIRRWLAHHHPDRKVLQMDFSQIRSLPMSGAAEQIPLDRFIYLVVLDLEGWTNLKDGDLLQICSNRMCLLVFLSIRNTSARELPWQIKELRSLRTLDVSHTGISELPLEVCELEYLCKLDLRNTNIKLLPNQIARLCHLQDLLIGIDETLCRYPISLIKAFGELENLRVFAITLSFQQCTNGAYTDALLSSLKKWRHLESLTMRCDLGCNMDFLNLVSNHPPKLEKFKITAGRFVSVPQWIESLQHLAFLQITVCKLDPRDLKILAGLLRLRCLGLDLEFIPTEEIVIGSDGFKMLERLSISFLVPWITFKKGAMLRLAYLELEVIPASERERAVPSGLRNLQSLTEVVLHYNQKWCSNSSSIKKTVEALNKEVYEHCNPIDLVINSTKHDVQKFDETEWATKIHSEGECETKSSTSSQDKQGTVIPPRSSY